jgi:hypothetical protein
MGVAATSTPRPHGGFAVPMIAGWAALALVEFVQFLVLAVVIRSWLLRVWRRL